MQRVFVGLVVLSLAIIPQAGWGYNFEQVESWNAKRAGTPIDLGQFQALNGRREPEPSLGSLTVLHIWATWCVPCVVELPHFDAYAEGLSDRGVKVLTLAVDKGGGDDVESFLKKHRVLTKIPILLDPTYRVADAFGIRTLPTTILVKNGVEVRRLIGRGDWEGDEAEELERLLKSLN